MLPFAAFRRWSKTHFGRAILPATLATAITIVAVGSMADEPAAPVKKTAPAAAVKIAPANPLTTVFSALISGNAATAKAAAPAEPVTHARQSDFFVKGHDEKGWLQAFAVDSQGRLLAAVGSKATYGVGVATQPAVTREVQVFSADGKPLQHWSLDFDPQRIAVGPKDEVFVAGGGKIARLDKTGKQIALVDSPHLEAVLGDADALRESAEQQRQQMVNSYKEVLKSIETQKGLLQKRIETLEEQAKKAAEEKAAESKAADDKKVSDKPATEAPPAASKSIRRVVISAKPPADADDIAKPQAAQPRIQVNRATDRETPQLTALKRQLIQNEAQVKQYQQILEQQENRSIDDIVREIKQRLQKINSIAVSDEDVFITTGIAKGYGFAVWRTDHDLKNPKQIVTNLSGCCGQMDVQCIGGEVFIAENTRHRVGRYDRDGKQLATFGSRERESAGACFGGCCNPMNVCLGPNGTVLTAESEGFVKSFSTDGTYVGLIGKAQVGGGCKNVSIASSPDGDRVYFYDLDKSRVVVMAREKPSDEAKTEKTAQKD
jgi:hypothetical protein